MAAEAPVGRVPAKTPRVPEDLRGVGPAGCPAGPPSEPCLPLLAAHGASKPLGHCGLKCCAPALASFKDAVAGGVYQGCGGLAGAGLLAGRAGCALDVPLGDTPPPVLPFLGRGGHVAGCQEPVPAERTAVPLPAEQARSGAVQRGAVLVPAVPPVACQARVVRG